MLELLSDAVRQLVHTKGISEELILSAIKDALLAAYKKTFGTDSNAETIVNEDKGEVHIYSRKEVVDEVSEDLTEIALEDAELLNADCEIGDEILIEVKPNEFGHIATQTAKQIIVQRLREIEKNLIYSEFIKKKDHLITGLFQRERDGNIFVDLEKCEAILPRSGQSPREKYGPGDRIKAVIIDVTNAPDKGAPVVLSRSTPTFVRRVFEAEVPEIAEGLVDIINVVRDSGSRTKISVHSKAMDPVGACVGMKGIRIQTIIRELEGEKIDIVRYSDDVKDYIANALSPSTIERVVILNEENREVLAVVTDDQLSLAIGKNGQNVKLAAKLVEWNINIKTIAEFEEEGYDELLKQEADKLFSDVEEEHDIALLELGDSVEEKLRNAGYNSIENLIDKTAEDLENIPGIGPKTSQTIVQKIEELVEVVDDNNEEYEEYDSSTADDDFMNQETIDPSAIFSDDYEEVDKKEKQHSDKEVSSEKDDVEEEEVIIKAEDVFSDDYEDSDEEEEDKKEVVEDSEDEEYEEEDEALYCPICNTQVNETMRVCPGCGTELEFEYDE